MTLADDFEAATLHLPQADIPVRHIFGPGIYIREVTLPEGAAIIGHSHLAPHLCSLLSGSLAFVGEDGGVASVVDAPATFMAPAGRKAALVTRGPVVFQNIYATAETDVVKLEATYVEKSPAFLAHEAARALVSSLPAGYLADILSPRGDP